MTLLVNVIIIAIGSILIGAENGFITGIGVFFVAGGILSND